MQFSPFYQDARLPQLLKQCAGIEVAFWDAIGVPIQTHISFFYYDEPQ
jgi:hypothetical protein